MIIRKPCLLMSTALLIMGWLADLSIGYSQSPTEQHYLAHLTAANSALRLNEASEARRWLDEIPQSARAWEWQLLNARADSSVKKLTVDAWTPIRLDFSTDGQRLVVACTDGFVRIYQAQDLKLLAEWRVAEQAVYAARFHPQAQQLAVCSRDGNLSVWDIASQTQLWSHKSGGEGLADLVFSPDGHQLLFCSWFRSSPSVKGTVSLWEAATGQQKWKTEFGVKPIVTARFSSDGKFFAVGTWDALVGVWQTETLGEPRVFDFADQAQYSAIDDIAISPDSMQLAAATKAGAVRVWSLDGSAAAVDMIGNSSAVFSLAFSSDGKSLLTGDSDGVLAVWDISRRVKSHRFFGHANRIVSIDVFPNQSLAVTASADNSLRTWNLDAARGFVDPQAGKFAYGMVIANDGNCLVSGGQSETAVSVWDIHSKHALRHFDGTASTINYLDGDGKEWVAGGNWSGDICIWNINSGEIVRQMGSKELGGMQQCSLSDDRKWLAVTTNKKQVVIWNAQSGEVTKVIPMPSGCWGIDFATDGQALAVGDGQGIIHWISTTNWETLWSTPAGTNEIKTVRIAPSGQWLAIGTESGLLSIVDTKQRQVKHQVQGHSERIWSLDISPDEQRIVTGSADKKVKTWDPRTAVSLLSLADFTDPIYNVRFSPDGKSLFVNSLGSQIVKLAID
jgi:WD40 repeat protein